MSAVRRMIAAMIPDTEVSGVRRLSQCANPTIPCAQFSPVPDIGADPESSMIVSMPGMSRMRA